MEFSEEELKQTIRTIENFPKEGILFKDITPIFQHPELVKKSVMKMAEIVSKTEVNKIVCVESRGFWMGCMLAYELNLPMIPVRKPGKLPYKTIKTSYDLEYGRNTLEIHDDALSKGDKVLIHDDVLATGGTALASVELVNKLRAEVSMMMFMVELGFLNGRLKLKNYDIKIESLITY